MRNSTILLFVHCFISLIGVEVTHAQETCTRNLHPIKRIGLEEPHLRATGCHLLYGITQCYLPSDTSERTPPNPSHADWYSIYLPRRDGRLSWPVVDLIASRPAGSRTSDLTDHESDTQPLHHQVRRRRNGGSRGSSCSTKNHWGRGATSISCSPMFCNLQLIVTLQTIRLLLTQKFSKILQLVGLCLRPHCRPTLRIPFFRKIRIT